MPNLKKLLFVAILTIFQVGTVVTVTQAHNAQTYPNTTYYASKSESENNFWTNLKKSFRKIDTEIFLSVNQTVKSKLCDYLMSGMTFLGNGFVLVPLMGLVLFIYNQQKFKYNFLIFILILLLGGIIIQILKFIFDQPRPLKQLQELISTNQIQIKVLLEPLREKGFPSGHTQTIFTAAVFLSKKIKSFWWIFYFIAILVGISRIYVGAHFPGDVIGGAIVGVLITEISLRLINRYRSWKNLTLTKI